MTAAAPSGLRSAVAERLARLGMPTRADEDWRYVDVGPLAMTPAPGQARVDTGAGEPAIAIADGRIRLALPPGAEAVPADDDAIDDADQVRLWALAGERAALRLRGRVDLDLRAVATGGVSGWRLHLAIEPGADVRLSIDLRDLHALTGAGASRMSGWLTCILGAGARLRVAERTPAPLSTALLAVNACVSRDATLAWTGLSQGGVLFRQDLRVALAEPGAACDIAVADRVDGRFQAHRLTRILHAARDTRSRQLVKAMLDGHAAASCDALIAIRPGADGSDAELQNRNLVLSPTARADTRPQLDIRADEVKAAHGATVGRFDPDEMTYLRLRGLDEAAARALLGGAFIAEVADRFAEGGA